MRHEQLKTKDSYDKVDVAAVWPVGQQIAPLPIIDIEEQPREHHVAAAPAAPDVPASVGGMIAASYAALIAAFAIATVGSADSLFMVTISALFVLIYFTVPAIFLRVEPGSESRPGLAAFLRDGMDTFTGHSSGAAALVQMLIVPVFLTIGVLVMGIASALIS